jgi:hypothetical protein
MHETQLRASLVTNRALALTGAQRFARAKSPPRKLFSLVFPAISSTSAKRVARP